MRRWLSRRWGPAGELDRAVEIDDVPQWSTGAPLPMVVATDTLLLLGYRVVETTDDRDGEFAVVEFLGSVAHVFGPPNDEALNGHPLYDRGLQAYGAHVIMNSAWVRHLEQINRVHPSHDPTRYQGLRHYVFCFKDATFECVALALRTHRHAGSMADALVERARRAGDGNGDQMDRS